MSRWLPNRSLTKPRKRLKYLNDPKATALGVGGLFDSRKEARRGQELLLLERAGEITHLRRQVEFEVIPACGEERKAVYVADFTYYEGGQLVVEDTKSEPTRKTRDYVLKRKLMNWRLNIQVREV